MDWKVKVKWSIDQRRLLRVDLSFPVVTKDFGLSDDGLRGMWCENCVMKLPIFLDFIDIKTINLRTIKTLSRNDKN